MAQRKMLAYIGLGSNLGEKLDNCRRAIRAVTSDPRNQLRQVSRFYVTEPVGKKDQNWFVNGVIAVETSLPPRELLNLLLDIERRMGRQRGERWGPRIIDLDILFWGQEVMNEDGLELPHPRLHERRFVLLPLLDIAPFLEHPLLGKNIGELLAVLKGEEEVLPLPEGEPTPCTASCST